MRSHFCEWLTQLSTIAKADNILVEAQHHDVLVFYYNENKTPEEAYPEYVKFRDRWIALTCTIKANQTEIKLRLRQMFKDQSDCYADTHEFSDDTVPPTKVEGPVEQAMSEDTFVEVVSNLLYKNSRF